LATFAAGLRTELTGQGFNRHAVAQHTHLLAHLSEWLAERGLAADGLNTDVLHAYLSDRRAAGYGFLISLRGMAPILRYLCGLDVIRELGLPTPTGPVEQLLAEYRRYLTTERSLAPLSVDRYSGTARLFLSGLPAPVEESLWALSAPQVTDFVVAEAGRRRIWATKPCLSVAVAAGLPACHRAYATPVGGGSAVGGRVGTGDPPSRGGWRARRGVVGQL